MKTSVISVRLPEAVANELKAYCKSNDTNISKYLQDSFSDVSNISLSGVDQIDSSIEPTPEVGLMLISMGSGSVAGLLAYKAVKSVMLKKGFDEEKADMTAFVAGVAGALVIGGGLYSILKQSK